MIHNINATGKALGRLAAEIAVILRGKNQPEFLRHVDSGEGVEVSNVQNIKFTGKKLKQKIYFKHSGYMGGLKAQRLEEKLEKNPADVLRRAVYGMLPKNRTRDKIIKRLKISA